MSERRLRALALVALAALPGCFDSLVSGRCADGYVAVDGVCRAGADHPDAADAPPDGPEAGGDPDGGNGGGGDGGGPPVCPAGEQVCDDRCVDVQVDPDHCGACGRWCASGLCEAAACAGVVGGHVVAIGHDYRTYRPPGARVLGNAVGLGARPVVRVMVWEGDAELEAADGVLAALTAGMGATGRPWTQVAPTALPPEDRGAADVLLILPQRGGDREALGASYRARLTGFVDAGGVVIALGGPASTTADLVRGAALLDVAPGPALNGQPLTVVGATDALAVGVLSPYAGSNGTASFLVGSGGPAVVVARAPAEPVVIHRTVAP